MALLKDIELENGITTKYHRIVSLNKIINVQNIIEVASYTSQEKRKDDVPSEEEKNIYIETKYINTPYDENMTVEDAYNYLKTTDEFENSQDI